MHPFSCLLEDLIAHQVTVSVVYLFEVVQVSQQHTHQGRFSGCANDFLVEAVGNGSVVPDAG